MKTGKAMTSNIFGQRDRCCICRSLLSVPLDVFAGDMQCPRCLAPLGFLVFPEAGAHFFLRRGNQPALDALIALVGNDAAGLVAVLRDHEQLGADSLDMIEVLTELEDLL